MKDTATFETWAIVDVMGHQRFAGYLTERTIGGKAFLQIDVPEVFGKQAAFSRILGPDSIYAIQPVTEEVARDIARELKKSPLTEWDFTPELRETIKAGRRLLSSSPPQSVRDNDS
tara:strand:+ start:288963 stop:289310 length:348 start_codon:yes stop_codon:yes gene_type:complete